MNFYYHFLGWHSFELAVWFDHKTKSLVIAIGPVRLISEARG